MKISEITTMYRCDNCKKEFMGKDLKYEHPPKNIHMHGGLGIMNFRYLDKDLKSVGGSEPPGHEDYILKCPKCDKPHLFGFDPIRSA